MSTAKTSQIIIRTTAGRITEGDPEPAHKIDRALPGLLEALQDPDGLIRITANGDAWIFPARHVDALIIPGLSEETTE